MDDFLDLVLDFVEIFLMNNYDSFKLPKIKKGKPVISNNLLDDIGNHDAFVTGFIATAIALMYADDYALDKNEKKKIKQLIKKYRHILSKHNIKEINYIKKHFVGIHYLKFLYRKLNLDEENILKIINEIQTLIKEEDEYQPRHVLLNQIKSYLKSKVVIA